MTTNNINNETYPSDIKVFNAPEFIYNPNMDMDTMIDLYKDMLQIRYMEQYLSEQYKKGNIRGFCHLVIGEEGLYAVLKNIIVNDCIITSYRCHGAAYAAGLSLKEIICENLGTKEGNCKGKGGSMHLYGERLFGGHGIVGAQVPLGTGLAFALKYKAMENINSKNKSKEEFLHARSTDVCFCVLGDGAANQGQVYESYNMAKLYNLPIVFIVENNRFGMYTPVENATVDDCFFKRGYKIPGIRVRDTKIAELKGALVYSKEYCKINGPIIVQVDTFRKCGHSTLDNGSEYISKDLMEKEESLDCLLHLGNDLKSKISQTEVEKIRENAYQTVQECVDSIDIKNLPDPSEFYTDLFFKE